MSFGCTTVKVELAHPQEVLDKQHSVYCLRVMSVGCIRVEVDFNPDAAN
jgi:hypothetical protein